jgi:uncharacterized protein GlcG (DUF336 family)
MLSKKLRNTALASTATLLLIAAISLGQAHENVNADNRDGTCQNLPGWGALKNALVAAVAVESSGLDLQMWGTIVDRDGIVCAVAFSGVNRGAQWPGSRVISAQKANTANSFSLDSSLSEFAGASILFPKGLVLSTANLFSAVQPGGSLFGLQESNPVNVLAAYAGPSDQYGKHNDPLVGQKIGGVNVFGGGLGLYDLVRQQGGGRVERIVGGLGVSGDTSCSDHYIAWRVRRTLDLDHLKNIAGVSGDVLRPDNIVYDITANPNGGTGKSAGGFGHPPCIRSDATDPASLPAVQN